MTAKVQFKDDTPEYRFDFTFPALSKEPAPPASSLAATRGKATPARPAPTSDSAVVSASAPTGAAPADVDPGRIRPPIPETLAESLSQLKARNEQIRDLVQAGDFAAVWVPAFQAKDLAIALEGQHLDGLTAVKRQAAEPAIQRLVRTAWLLDAFGDVGNRQQIVDAYAIFASAVADVVSAFTVP